MKKYALALFIHTGVGPVFSDILLLLTALEDAAIPSMEIHPVGYIRSPYKQKFAIPRQPGLVKAATGEVVFLEAYADPNGLREIEQFSHLWLLFRFHETADQGWTPTVQPPRLGGRERVGVFASRSTFRPNGIGMSVVENLGVEQRGAELILKVGAIDLLDKTPVIDIKPYIPYADALPDARAGYAAMAPVNTWAVDFSEDAYQQLEALGDGYPDLKALITGVLEQDPRPAWRQKQPDDKQYGMALYDLNIKWRIDGDWIRVIRIERVATTK